MKCPACKGKTLTQTERSGVSLNICPNCHGAWLARGALDRIVDLAPDTHYSTEGAYADTNFAGRLVPHPVDFDHRASGYYGKRERKGFVAELFDF